jgi:hypothetical protein
MVEEEGIEGGIEEKDPAEVFDVARERVDEDVFVVFVVFVVVLFDSRYPVGVCDVEFRLLLACW